MSLKKAMCGFASMVPPAQARLFHDFARIPNLGPKSQAMLNAAGIHTLADLQPSIMGEGAAFKRLLANHPTNRSGAPQGC